MNEILDRLAELNWQTILAMFAVGWYFTRDIKDALVKLENDVRQQGKRTDKIYELILEERERFSQEMRELRTDVNRIQADYNQKFYELLNRQK